MITTETVIINDKTFIKTYSNTGFYIDRDGAQYSEAIDPIEFSSERIYTETNIPIEEDEISSEIEQKAQAWDALVGEENLNE